MKVSRAASRQLKTVESIDERVDRLEAKIDRILAHLGIDRLPEGETVTTLGNDLNLTVTGFDPAITLPDSKIMVEQVRRGRKRKAG